jgi:gluconate kinase
LVRVDHFMPPALLASQFATLERPTIEETDVTTLDAERPAHELAVELINQRAGVLAERGYQNE